MEGLEDTCRVAVATLASWEVVEALFALVAPGTIEILATLTFALCVAGGANGTMAVAVASCKNRNNYVERFFGNFQVQQIFRAADLLRGEFLFLCEEYQFFYRIL